MAAKYAYGWMGWGDRHINDWNSHVSWAASNEEQSNALVVR